MSSSLMALLSRKGGPALPTQKGLIVLGPQNEFLSANGKLPVENPAVVLDRIARLVPSFHEHGIVIWVRAEHDPSRSPDDAGNVSTSLVSSPARPSSSKGSTNTGHRRSLRAAQNQPDTSAADAELFLSKRRQRGPCCLAKSTGASYVPRLDALIDRTRDIQIVTNDYSALQTTSLLQTLRMRFITDVYLAGCPSNISVYATALDVARYGVSITLVEDCLGYWNLMRHQVAIKRLKTLIGISTSSQITVIDRLRHKESVVDDTTESDEANNSDESETETASTTSSQVKTSTAQIEPDMPRTTPLRRLMPSIADPHSRDEAKEINDDSEEEEDDDTIALTIKELNAKLSRQSPRSTRTQNHPLSWRTPAEDSSHARPTTTASPSSAHRSAARPTNTPYHRRRERPTSPPRVPRSD